MLCRPSRKTEQRAKVEAQLDEVESKHKASVESQVDAVGQLAATGFLLDDIIASAMPEIPPRVLSFTWLRQLILRNCPGVAVIPDGIVALTALDLLCLDGGSIKVIPAAVSKLPVLRALRLTHQAITSLSTSPTLQTLQALPPGKLTELCLTGNPLCAWPQELCDPELLTALSYLNLADCRLPSVPVEITNLRRIRQLELSGNPMNRERPTESIPLQVYQRMFAKGGVLFFATEFAQEIIPGLLLGPFESVDTAAKIKKLRLTHLVTVGSWMKPVVPKGVRYLKYDVQDNVLASLQPFFHDALAFINEGVTMRKGRVLVHCAAGRSRSASIVLAYLLWRKPELTSVREALAFVRSHRPHIDPNPSFVVQIEAYHQDILAARAAAGVPVTDEPPQAVTAPAYGGRRGASQKQSSGPADRAADAPTAAAPAAAADGSGDDDDNSVGAGDGNADDSADHLGAGDDAD